MRAVVIRESLKGGELPAGLRGRFLRKYPHLLDETTEIEIVELIVDEQHALGNAMLLAAALLPKRYYAHVLGEDEMYIAFPDCVASVRRAEPETAEQAQTIGRLLFDIPLSQMRFIEMFDVDHPDSVGSGAERPG